MGAETAALALATPLDLNEAVALIHGGGGLAVAAHIDRKSFSVFSQLGFIPAGTGFDMHRKVLLKHLVEAEDQPEPESPAEPAAENPLLV